MKNIKSGYLIAFIVLLITFPILVGFASYPIYMAGLIAIYAIMAMSLNLLTGYGGQVSLGHAAFLAIGAYTSAILTLDMGLSFWLSFPIAGLVTAFVGFIIGLPAVRLSGHFLAIATLGFGVAIPEILLKWDKVTGGFTGLFPTNPTFFSFSIESDTHYYYLIIGATILITWMISNIIKSRIGRAFVAIRESEVAATAMGIHVPRYKALMFSISAFFTGLAGSLYAHFVGYISPHDFSMNISLILLAMIVVGGLASIPGSIIGAIIMMLIPQLTDHLTGLTTTITGLFLVVVILFLPDGIVGLFSSLRVKGHSKKDTANLSG